MRGSGPGAALQRAGAGVRAAFRGIAASAALSVVVALCGIATADAQDKPAPPTLRVATSHNGRLIFDHLLGAIATPSTLGVELAIKDTDSLGALRDFCRNAAGASPDIVLTTHSLQPALAAECAKNGVDDIAGIELGRSALILAVRSGSMLSSLTSRQVYLAIAREVPYRDEFGRNTAVRWSDVDPALPAQDIRFQLPMRDEARRVMLDQLVLEGGCRNEPAVKLIFAARLRTARCVTIRSDRVREIPRAQAVRALLDAPLGTVGVLSYLDISQTAGALEGLALDGMRPSSDDILRGTYDYAISYWLYAKRGQAARGGNPAVDAAVERIVARAPTEPMIGPDGVLSGLGLVPLPADERHAQRDALAAGRDQYYSVWPVLSWLTGTASGAWGMLVLSVTQPPPRDPGSTVDFTTLMDIAGYKISQIDSSVGIIPEASMTFGVAREMTDADQEYLERMLRRDAL